MSVARRVGCDGPSVSTRLAQSSSTGAGTDTVKGVGADNNDSAADGGNITSDAADGDDAVGSRHPPCQPCIRGVSFFSSLCPCPPRLPDSLVAEADEPPNARADAAVLELEPSEKRRKVRFAPKHAKHRALAAIAGLRAQTRAKLTRHRHHHAHPPTPAPESHTCRAAQRCRRGERIRCLRHPTWRRGLARHANAPPPPTHPRPHTHAQATLRAEIRKAFAEKPYWTSHDICVRLECSTVRRVQPPGRQARSQRSDPATRRHWGRPLVAVAPRTGTHSGPHRRCCQRTSVAALCAAQTALPSRPSIRPHAHTPPPAHPPPGTSQGRAQELGLHLPEARRPLWHLCAAGEPARRAPLRRGCVVCAVSAAFRAICS